MKRRCIEVSGRRRLICGSGRIARDKCFHRPPCQDFGGRLNFLQGAQVGFAAAADGSTLQSSATQRTTFHALRLQEEDDFGKFIHVPLKKVFVVIIKKGG